MNKEQLRNWREARALCWPMRIIGLVLIGASLFLLTRDFGLGVAGVTVLLVTTALGALTFIASLLPIRRPSIEEEMALQTQAAPVPGMKT